MIGIDASEVINHPNRAADATALYNARCISKKVYLEAMGYNENDLPPEDELNEQIGIAIRDGSYAKYGIPAVRANVETAPGDLETAPEQPDPATGGKNAPGPPAKKTDAGPGSGQDKAPNQNSGPGGANAGPAITASADQRTQELHALAQAGVRRGREMAGARVRSMTTGRNAKRCVDCYEAIKGVPAWNCSGRPPKHLWTGQAIGWRRCSKTQACRSNGRSRSARWLSSTPPARCTRRHQSRSLTDSPGCSHGCICRSSVADHGAPSAA